MYVCLCGQTLFSDPHVVHLLFLAQIWSNSKPLNSVYPTESREAPTLTCFVHPQVWNDRNIYSLASDGLYALVLNFFWFSEWCLESLGLFEIPPLIWWHFMHVKIHGYFQFKLIFTLAIWSLLKLFNAFISSYLVLSSLCFESHIYMAVFVIWRQWSETIT